MIGFAYIRYYQFYDVSLV